MRIIVVFVGAALCLAACGPQEKPAQFAALPANAASGSMLVNSADVKPPIALVPDEEAESIPTLGGLPLVPMSGDNAVALADPRGSVSAQPIRRFAENFDTNTFAVRIIKEEETLQLRAYELGGLWLIGYGHLMLQGEPDPINEPQAESLLVGDLDWCERSVERFVTVPLTHNEFSAVSAFCYNVGSAKLRNSSIVRLLNAGDRAGAANAFLLWNRMNGRVMTALAKRRARERELFLTP
jgi:lysozyme